ncbi:MAG: histidine kinase [Ignavibacteriae bacterium]|nr:histidine kinase [Ignavibacteriota bacterium]
MIKKTIRDKDYLQKLLIEKKQTELNMLRNQLQPHFLFNALNNLMSLANSSKNVKLVNSFDKLSQLLRFVIEDNQTEKIAIDKEILFLKNYIDLQLLRFEEEEVQIQFKIIGKYNTQKVEPGLFIPFVENAFKYGTEPERTAVVEIEFDLTNEKEVQFKIKNKILIASKNNFGTGIETTRKRLELIYPNRHKLAITETKDFIVQLYINTQ